jgi:hypothetical protein
MLVRLELRQGGFLECKMGMQVGLGRFDRLMTEPQRDHGAIDPCLQQLHRSTVPEHGKHPMRATFRRRFRREMLCSLIGELMGKLHGGGGSLRPRAAQALVFD